MWWLQLAMISHEILAFSLTKSSINASPSPLVLRISGWTGGPGGLHQQTPRRSRWDRGEMGKNLGGFRMIYGC